MMNLAFPRHTGLMAILAILPLNSYAQVGVNTQLPWEKSTDSKWASATLASFPTPRHKPGRIMFRKVPMTEPYVAITYDDGPHPQNTPRLLDMLKQRGIRATFFIVGDRTKQDFPRIAQRIHAEGHEIGNHTWSHKHYFDVSPEHIVIRELELGEKAIEEVTGVKPTIMRPPGERIRHDQTDMIYDRFGYRDIRWSVDPGDALVPTPSAGTIAARILAQVHKGAIILSHDLKKPTVDAMPVVLDQLLARGFKFLTVSELLAMDKPQAVSGLDFTEQELASLSEQSSD